MGPKRYCVKCQMMRPMASFGKTSKGSLQRNCSLHREKEKKEPTAPGQKFCVVCEVLRPVEDFEPRVKNKSNRVCMRHTTERKDGALMAETSAELRTCIACSISKPREAFDSYGKTRFRQKCRECDPRGSSLPAVRATTPLTPVSSRSLPHGLAPSPSLHPAMNTNGRYAKLFAEQDGRCAICGQPETACDEIGQILPLSLYGAAHFNGRVYGLVCKLCNMGLSMFRDSPALLARAISFLTKKSPTAEGDIRVVQH